MLNIDRMLQALSGACDRVFAGGTGYATDEEAIAASVKLLENRLVHGERLFREWTGRLDGQLQDWSVRLDLANRAPELLEQMNDLRAQMAQADPRNKEQLDEAERTMLHQWAMLSARLLSDPRCPSGIRDELAEELSKAEFQRLTDRMTGGHRPEDARAAVEVDAVRLRAYLRDRFADPSIEVPEFRQLPGGYGKETTLFAVTGEAFAGEYVMRRDRDAPIMDNDCHRIEVESQVIRVAHSHGFPAPEAEWCDTEHAMLPGGHFLIMRRAPGTTGGDVFGASGQVSDDLTRLLATSVARLHSLPAMRELGAISDGIHPELWDLSFHEVTKRYIMSIRDLYLAQVPEPVPAVIGLFGWLLNNVPDAPGRPVLLHGDIGFHNFIVDEGRLSAVVDWEFAHIGDPAEDVGYVHNTVGRSIDWNLFMRFYREAGGAEIDAERLRFFRLWGHLRNLAACQMTTSGFEAGVLGDLKIAHVGHSMSPMFLNAILGVMADK